MRLYLKFILIIIGSCKSGFGQQLFVQRYPTETHQASVQNWNIAQDQQGTFFFANTDGVLIFDGIHWDLLPLPGNAYCRGLAIDENGRVYVGAENGFGYLQKRLDGKFEYVSLMGLLDEKTRAAVESTDNVAVYGGSVFFSDGAHCYIYRNEKIDVLDMPYIWFVPLGDSLYGIDENANTLYHYRDGAFRNTYLKLEVRNIRLIVGYKGKYFLIVDLQNRMLVVDPKSTSKEKTQILSEEINATIKNLFVRRICPLADGRFAILTDHEIIIIDLNGKILSKVTSGMLSESNLWSSIFHEDAQHNVWFVTDEFLGLVITSSPIAYYDKTNGFKGVVFSLGAQGEERYVGTDIGLYHQQHNHQFEIIPGTEGVIWGIYSYKDRNYLAHSDGAFEVVEQRVTKLISHESVLSICVLRHHPECIVMGTFDTGIWLLTKSEGSWSKRKIMGFDGEARFIQQDTLGNLWISHDGKGIWKLRLNEKMDSIIEKTIYTTSSGLPSNLNNRVFKLNNETIVAGTANGIYTYNEASDIFEPDNRFVRALQGSIVYSLAESPEGQIYFRGRESRGKMKQVSGVLLKQADNTYNVLRTPFDKITWVDSDAPLIATQNGAWFGNNNKVIAYNPNQQTFFEESLEPIIKMVTAADSVIYVDRLIHQAMNIPYSRNSMLFSFNVAYYEDVEKNEFQYKLTGLDKEWSAWTNAREAHFTNLPEGDYTFEVRARNVYNNESTVASYTFQVDPPIYRTVWAYIVYVLLFIALVYWLTVLRTKRVNIQKRILEKEVHEKTKEILMQSEALEQQAEILKASNNTKDKLFSIISHDLRGPIRQFGEVFNLIEQGYISVEEFQHKLMPNLKESANYVATLTDNLLQWARGQMGGIQVNKAEFNLADVIHENVSLLNPQAIKKSITLKTEITEGLPKVYADKDMVSLIVRNLVSNAIKFTPENGIVSVVTKPEPDYIFISVHDNGTGLSEEDINKILEKEYFTKYGTSGEKGSGLGLMLCREFIEKNGGEFSVESQQGVGSTFTFCLAIAL
jgi:signal transduction histidine kinase